MNKLDDGAHPRLGCLRFFLHMTGTSTLASTDNLELFVLPFARLPPLPAQSESKAYLIPTSPSSGIGELSKSIRYCFF